MESPGPAFIGESWILQKIKVYFVKESLFVVIKVEFNWGEDDFSFVMTKIEYLEGQKLQPVCRLYGVVYDWISNIMDCRLQDGSACQRDPSF